MCRACSTVGGESPLPQPDGGEELAKRKGDVVRGSKGSVEQKCEPMNKDWN